MVTFVFIPGLLSDARVWAPLRQALGRAADVVDADVTADPSIAAMARRILEEVPGPLIPVGHSMGGRVAMEMAHQAPGRIAALVLANTGHAPRKPDERPGREAKIALGHADMSGLAAEWLPPMLAPGRDADTMLMQDLTQMVLAAGPDVHERQIRALLDRPDASAYLRDLTMPIFLVTGAQDGWSPEAQHREIAEAAADAELAVIEGAGHFLPLEQPAALVQAVTGWLRRRGFPAP